MTDCQTARRPVSAAGRRGTKAGNAAWQRQVDDLRCLADRRVGVDGEIGGGGEASRTHSSRRAEGEGETSGYLPISAAAGAHLLQQHALLPFRRVCPSGLPGRFSWRQQRPQKSGEFSWHTNTSLAVSGWLAGWLVLPCRPLTISEGNDHTPSRGALLSLACLAVQ